MSWNRNVFTTGTLVLALAAAAACNRDPAPETEVGEGAGVDVDRTFELQRERDEEIADLQERVTELEREYAENTQEVARGEAAATAGLREELKQDMTSVRQAVNDLRTTTAENWWERHEQALEQALDDVEQDVTRLAGQLPSARPQPTATTGESPSAKPFTSSRDEMVAQLRARIDAMDQRLDNVTASGPRETELDDTRARVDKLGEDLDRLRSASPDDWWDITRARVADYIDRVENSVDRLVDNEPRSATSTQ